MSAQAIARPHSAGNSWRRDAGCVHDWFAYSGLPPLDEVRNDIEYARRLTQYISDPTTIRVRTLEKYGRAPSVEAIREMRQHRLEIVDYRATSSYTYGLKREAERKARKARQPATGRSERKALRADEYRGPASVDRSVLCTAADVIDACADACGISHGELIGTMRFPKFIRPRNLAATILRARGNSYPVVGKFLGGREHTGVINSVRKFFERDIKDERYLALWEAFAPTDAVACRSVVELDAVLASRAA